MFKKRGHSGLGMALEAREECTKHLKKDDPTLITGHMDTTVTGLDDNDNVVGYTGAQSSSVSCKKTSSELLSGTTTVTFEGLSTFNATMHSKQLHDNCGFFQKVVKNACSFGDDVDELHIQIPDFLFSETTAQWTVDRMQTKNATSISHMAQSHMEDDHPDNHHQQQEQLNTKKDYYTQQDTWQWCVETMRISQYLELYRSDEEWHSMWASVEVKLDNTFLVSLSCMEWAFIYQMLVQQSASYCSCPDGARCWANHPQKLYDAWNKMKSHHWQRAVHIPLPEEPPAEQISPIRSARVQHHDPVRLPCPSEERDIDPCVWTYFSNFPQELVNMLGNINHPLYWPLIVRWYTCLRHLQSVFPDKLEGVHLDWNVFDLPSAIEASVSSSACTSSDNSQVSSSLSSSANEETVASTASAAAATAKVASDVASTNTGDGDETHKSIPRKHSNVPTLLRYQDITKSSVFDGITAGVFICPPPFNMKQQGDVLWESDPRVFFDKMKNDTAGIIDADFFSAINHTDAFDNNTNMQQEKDADTEKDEDSDKKSHKESDDGKIYVIGGAPRRWMQRDADTHAKVKKNTPPIFVDTFDVDVWPVGSTLDRRRKALNRTLKYLVNVVGPKYGVNVFVGYSASVVTVVIPNVSTVPIQIILKNCTSALEHVFMFDLSMVQMWTDGTQVRATPYAIAATALNIVEPPPSLFRKFNNRAYVRAIRTIKYFYRGMHVSRTLVTKDMHTALCHGFDESRTSPLNQLIELYTPSAAAAALPSLPQGTGEEIEPLREVAERDAVVKRSPNVLTLDEYRRRMIMSQQATCGVSKGDDIQSVFMSEIRAFVSKHRYIESNINPIHGNDNACTAVQQSSIATMAIETENTIKIEEEKWMHALRTKYYAQTTCANPNDQTIACIADKLCPLRDRLRYVHAGALPGYDDMPLVDDEKWEDESVWMLTTHKQLGPFLVPCESLETDDYGWYLDGRTPDSDALYRPFLARDRNQPVPRCRYTSYLTKALVFPITNAFIMYSYDERFIVDNKRIKIKMSPADPMVGFVRKYELFDNLLQHDPSPSTWNYVDVRFTEATIIRDVDTGTIVARKDLCAHQCVTGFVRVSACLNAVWKPDLLVLEVARKAVHTISVQHNETNN